MRSLRALFAALALAAAAAAAPTLHSRQVVNQLTVIWGKGGEKPGNIYLSNSDYACGPYPVQLSGQHPPFRVDAIAYPYSDTNQTVLSPLVQDWQSNAFDWFPTFPVDTEFVLRMMDSQNETAYSAEKKVRNGYSEKWLCDVNAAAIYPRQAVDQLSVGWGTGGEEAGNIYLSNAKYTCGPCPIVLAGNYPPFSIDAVSFPYSEENQTVLTTVVTDWQSNAFDWYPVLAVDTVFALRITDGRNNTALSVEKTVKEGNGGWGCE
ncbi:hypothetical protein JCM10207_007903 [Rhodosporidiobolus poonsookiae]